MAAPRDYFVCVFPDDTITRRERHEFVWKVQAFDVEPHAAVGYFDYVAGARVSASLKLDFRDTVVVAVRLVPLFRS
jgi:hypothetical protein